MKQKKRDVLTANNLLSLASLRVLESRYLLRNENGKIIETPQQLFKRVSSSVAHVDLDYWKNHARDRKKLSSPLFPSLYEKTKSKEEFVASIEKKFFKLMSELKFLPNSPTLMNAGKAKGQLSACYVLPIEDSLEKVFETLKQTCLIHKSGGGTGFNFGKLRSQGATIKSSGGAACGPMGFLKIFDQSTQVIKQGGVRRGANMAILPIDHPDIESFISSKINGGIENFNISVGISNAFMDAVQKNKPWSLIEPSTKKVVKKIAAKKLWKEIVSSAWQCGDPGLVFLDQINKVNPTPKIGMMASTNPCGEQPLLPFESCNLGSLNLLAYVKDGKINWNELEKDIPYMVRFLDNIIDLNSYPIIETEEITLKNRKIGLGLMGWADTLLELEIPYDSLEAQKLGEEIMFKINELAVKTSQHLALEKGAFNGFSLSLWAEKGESSRRNATVTTVAPTGTISIIAEVSSGIEPIFSFSHERVALDKEVFQFIHPKLESLLKKYGLDTNSKIKSKILASGSIQEVKEFPKKVKRFMKNSLEIKPLDHIKMQAAFQKNVENGVSKTINLPVASKMSDIEKSYKFAYLTGCKGITVFRDQSKKSQVLSKGIRKK